MKYLKVLLLLLFLGSLSTRFAYAGGLEQKSYIVHFVKSPGEAQLKEVCGQYISYEALDPEKTYYRFRFNPALVPEHKVVSLFRTLPYYRLHQEDTEIHFRATVPDDTLLYRQWHLDKIGATQAWDITRGGVNRNGDTIVIAVVDDGLHINHPDFQGNLWVNSGETAGNLIDDDSNGYVDDRFGWNFQNNNNDISDSDYYAAGHGTPVAGIIGARGNNVTGIAGIAWHVKLMIVNIADTGYYRLPIFQSDAIRAYSYVLQQRKLYNSSGGKKGAFVVAANSSWGVDGKFPHQAPLWCAFYDTLGKHGILAVGAVSNIQSAQSLDVSGDLPTLCPSQHLITVQATTSDDMLFSSGFSSISVDMAAPGAGLFSTAAYTPQNIAGNTLYRSGYSGTSYAAPMVSGAIALLHAHACARVLDSIRLNPVKGNAMMRKFLLEGVDTVPGLNGKNLSGGRLNIRKSLEAMDRYCYGYTGITEQVSARINIFPNPSSSGFIVLSDRPVLRIHCTDPAGRTIELHASGDLWDVSSLTDGPYLLTLVTEAGIVRSRFLKMH